jgi:hypothetical protein
MEEIQNENLRVNNQSHVVELFLSRRHFLSYSIFIALFTKKSATVPILRHMIDCTWVRAQTSPVAPRS